MNPMALVKGALIGGFLGAAWNGVRGYGSRKSDREPLPTEHDNLALIDPDLILSLQELRDMAMMPQQHHAAFAQRYIAAIDALERIAAIEVQIERQEIVAGFRDATESSQLAELAMRQLRAIEDLFESIELRQQFRDKVTDIQAQIGSHLNNINVEALKY